MGKRIGMTDRPVRVAIIGAGPSGFYAAGALLEQEGLQVSIDIFDRLPTPFGLVRDGVAPDHQKIKSVTRIYDRIASDPRVRFFGNVTFGQDIKQEEMQAFYDQIVYAVGAPSDRHLNIPGEAFEGSYPATAFVGWYNGHPDYTGLDFDLGIESVAIVGNGNVAMDVTRILARSPEELARTDIADHALVRLRESRVRQIYLLGRRGPVQAAFTNPELRELGDIEGVEVVVDPRDLELDEQSQAALREDKEAARNLETLRQFAERPPSGATRRIYMRFLVSPVEILGEGGRVSALQLQHNELVPTESGYLRAEGKNCFERLPVQMVLRAIGYRGVALPGVPFDPRRAIIPNQQGRVVDLESGEVIPGQYVVGWAKRGPTGVIGTNKPDAVETVSRMVEDLPHICPVPEERATPAAAEAFIAERQPRYVCYADWRLLDNIERAQGREQGRPRVKFCRVEEMLAAIEASKQQA